MSPAPVVALDLSHVITAVVTMLGSLGAARFVFRGTRETSASSILENVWTKYGQLESRVSSLEGKVHRREFLLVLSRGQIIQLEEAWPEAHLDERPDRHPELRPFLTTGLIDQETNHHNAEEASA